MKKITIALITILFSMSVISSASMAGNWESKKANPRKAANYQMLQDESDDPYRSYTEVIQTRANENQNFTNKRRDNYYMLLEELEY